MERVNPFRPGSVVSPGMFCGREDELERLNQCLVQTRSSEPQHFLIEGDRGIGKSSLFYVLDKLAKGDVASRSGRYNYITVNITLSEAMSYDNVIDEILSGLKKVVAERDKLREAGKKAWEFLSRFQVAGFSYNKDGNGPLDPGRRLSDLSSTFAELLSGTAAAFDGILLLIDEADRPAANAQLGEICKLLSEQLARTGQNRVCIGLAGLPGIVDKLRRSHKSSPRMFSILKLQPLEFEECKEVIDKGLLFAQKNYNQHVTVTEEAKNLIADLSEGYPHFLQEFASSAYHVDQDDRIDDQDVYDGAFGENGALSQLGQKYFFDDVKRLGSENSRHVLKTMATHFDSWLDRSQIIRDCRLKPSTVDGALRKLRQHEVVVANPLVRGQYRIPNKTFAAWIKYHDEHDAAPPEPRSNPYIALLEKALQEKRPHARK